MAFVRRKTAPIREKRMGSLSAWYGSVGNLVREAQESGFVPRLRTFAQDASSDLIYALDLLGTIEDIAIVVHGPAGCAAGLHAARGRHPRWLVTNINERDSILGSDRKLRATIIEANNRHRPRAIVVVSSPVVVINNDDIDSVTEELREELDLPIIAVYADGFRSKIGATGLDVVVHALIKDLLPVEWDDTQAHVNLLALTENRANVALLEALLGELGLKSVVFPRFFPVGDAERVVSAQLSVAVNSAEASYAGEALEQDYRIPYLKPPSPIGLANTAQWLSAVAAATGNDQQAARVIARETTRLASLVESAAHLQGRKVFVHLPADHALAFWKLAGELGLDVVGIKVPFLDAAHLPALQEIAASNEALTILVGEGQAFEEISLLKSSRPDLYVGQGSASLHAARMGIATLVVDDLAFLGFSGFEKVLLQIERKLGNTSFQRFIAAGESEPYTHNWRQKSAYWHIKHEVK